MREIYKEQFLNAVELLCPGQQRTEILLRYTRFIITTTLLLAVIIGGTVVAAGIGTAGVVLGAQAKAKAETLEERMNELESRLQLAENSLKTQMKITKELKIALKALAVEVQDLESDLEKVKETSVDTSFGISYIVARLITGNQILKTAATEWKEGRVYPPLLDYFNYTLPCGDDCPLRFARAQKCWLSDDKKKLFMDFTVPVINRTLHLVEADPFTLIAQSKNKTCKVTYTGPTNAVVSDKENCVYSVNIKRADIVMAPDKECATSSKLPDGSNYFKLDHCAPRTPHDAWDYVQVKTLHDDLYIYCKGNNVTIGGRLEQCPNETFILPLTTNFDINAYSHRGGEVRANHQESLDPILSTRANWHLKPRANMEKIIKDIDKIPDQDTWDLDHPSKDSHLWFIGQMCALILIVGLLISLLFLFCKYRKVKILMAPARIPDAGELEMVDQA